MNPTTTQPSLSRRGLALAATALLALGAVACSTDSDTVTDADTAGIIAATEPSSTDVVETVEVTTTESASDTTSTIDTTEVAPADTTEVASTALTDDEVAGLLWMREEEQLAHDVYTTLGELWGIRIFENIASSEQSHVDAALQVLEQYDIDDPAAGNELGTFTDPQIQALYDELVADGSTSLVDALKVGALIEELDISDLRLRASATDVAALTTLYANLEKGSRNHLRAFTSQLEGRDVVYEPTQLDPDAYAAIVSSPTERGHDN